MDIQELWNKSLKETRIIRLRVQNLSSTDTTQLPYIFVGPSSVNPGDSVVRQGEVQVGKPAILLPSHFPQFEGFEFEKDLHFNQDTIVNFLLVRGVSFPSLKYQHHVSTVDLFEGPVERAVQHHGNLLERKEDVSTTLLTGPEEAWQFSVLMFIGMLVVRTADKDARAVLEEWRRRGRQP